MIRGDADSTSLIVVVGGWQTVRLNNAARAAPACVRDGQPSHFSPGRCHESERSRVRQGYECD
jgi:hypothetical protein